ncbi:store-operated calcium entry regulator STIMATE-like [Ylistrum balloti]|uniref:store-operated calcium entry regulator STIMATE-like n=1 Tax=Ylistrum balloti TaxID=509963 RepID=UPI002905A5C6|nr:store-operated calcium entry regulator STIMATE-like [Ylistrum balloti]
MSVVATNSNLNHSDLVNENRLNMDDHCNTGDLMGPLGLLVQAVLAFLAFTSLIVKRYCEPEYERRPWKIWTFDTSKQAFGAMVIHFANVYLADIFQGDPCTWYFISFMLDSTIGLFVVYLGLKMTQIVVKKYNYQSLKFGEYGNPPECNAWVGQCGLYILVMILEKFLMTLLVQFNFWKDVRSFLMSPVKDPHVELIIVMFIIPLIVNAFIFWVVDNFLKREMKGTKKIYLSDNDPSVKFYKTTEQVRCYNRIEKAEDFIESDLLVSTDEEGDARQRVDGTERLITT